MDLPISVIVLSALFALIAYKYIVYPSIISPLAQLPTAHPLCAFTSNWFERQRTNSGELKTLYAVHRRCGPIVRLGPNEVSVVSEEGLRQVYVAGLDKGPWYKKHFYNYGIQNLVCTLDHKTHSMHKRMISGVYQKSYLQHSPDMEILSRQIIFDRFLPLLARYSIEEKDADVVQLFEWTGVDLISGYIFGTGNSTNFLRDEQSRNHYFGEWAKMREISDYSNKPITEDLFMGMCKAAISAKDISDINSDFSRPTVISKMYNQMLALNKGTDAPRSTAQITTACASEMLDHIIATQETMTIMWTYILHRLSLDFGLQHSLHLELLRLQPPVILADKDKGLPSPSDIDGLPLLNAVVYETLRLHAANPARMPRVAPKGGLYLHGYNIPAGTIVSTNAYCLHRHEEAFPLPHNWIPERWLKTHINGGDVGSVPDPDLLRKYFWAFGSGPRMCIGQNFAIQALKLVVAAIYTEYTTNIVNDEGIEQTDSYNSGPASHRLILKFTRAQDT